jgi:potassium/hydrogen antiporter
LEVFSLFALAGIIIFLGFFGEIIFEKTNIPDIIWLMIFGVVLNIFFPQLANNPSFGAVSKIFTSFALIYILFEGALSINIKQLITQFFKGVNLTVVNFIFTTVIIGILMFIFFRWKFSSGLLLGAIVGGSSSAVVIPITKKITMNKNSSLILTIESAISDVLCIVGAVTLITLIGSDSGGLSINSIFNEVIIKFAVSILLGLFSGFMWIKIQKRMEKFTKSYMTTIAFLLLMYGFVEYMDQNGAIACLAFGLILGNSKKIMYMVEKDNTASMSHSQKFFYSEISFFVKSFFFVYLGLLMNFNDLGGILLGFLLTLIIFIIRPFVVLITVKTHILDKDRAFMEALAPKGLAAAVLAQIPAQAGLPYGEKYSTIVLSIIFFSILISTILIFIIEKGYFKGLGIKVIEKRRKRMH